MRVCYFGPYDPNYARNRVFLSGLRKNSIDVIECNSQSSIRLLDYARLLKRHQTLDYDAIILGAHGNYYGQPLVPFVRRLTKKPLVFDAMVTLYETEVVDRQLVDDTSVKSKLFYLLDRQALHNANTVLCDTNAHARYFSHLYDVEPEKFRRVLVGSDDEVFYPRRTVKKDDRFLVLFWGGFIPLQGVQYIIRAAKLLENHRDIRFELKGSGQMYKEALELRRSLGAKNVVFIPEFIPYNELASQVANADICLGIFGATEKAKRVIPNKAVETLAMRKPLITGDSVAAREILVNLKNSLLVPMANPEAIADAVLILKEDEKLREDIAEQGHKLFRDKLSPEAIGRELKSILTELIYKS